MPKDAANTPAAFDKIKERLFPEASRLRAELVDKLAELETAAANHLQSPVRNMALHISALVQDGRTDFEGLSDLVRLLTANAFTYRARKLRDYVGECSGAENEKLLRVLIESKTRDADGNLAAFQDFQKTIEREVIGIVITAHPTFSVSQRLTRILAELTTRGEEDGKGTGNLSAKSLEDLIAEAAETPHGSPEAITLDDEMEFALMAIANTRRTLRRVYRIVFAVAAEAYPGDWQRLTPKLLTVAS